MAATKKLWLNNLTNTRRSLARLIKEYHSDAAADTTRFRALIYSIRTLADVFRAEREMEFETRMQAIEESIRELASAEKR